MVRTGTSALGVANWLTKGVALALALVVCATGLGGCTRKGPAEVAVVSSGASSSSASSAAPKPPATENEPATSEPDADAAQTSR